MSYIFFSLVCHAMIFIFDGQFDKHGHGWQQFQQLYIGDSDGYAVRIACGSTSLDTSNLITGGVKEYRNHGHVYRYIDLFLDDPLYFIYP